MATRSDGGSNVIKRVSLLAAMALAVAAGLMLGPGQPVAGSSDERTLTLYNIHNGERLTVVYKRGDAYLPEGLEKLSWIFRDWRRNEATKMDPAAFDILWEVYRELGSTQPIHVISGFRSSRTNESLRKGGGGQAKNSQHIQGKALDVHFPDVPVQRLRYSALVRERGGVGYYPTSALPFVHIDTGRVRMWPRMPRQELALLFPNGKSKHLPQDGRAISMKDVELARAKNTKLAQTIAAYHALRAGAKSSTMVASLEPAATALLPVEAARPRSTPTLGSGTVSASLGGPKLASLIDMIVPQPVVVARPATTGAARLPVEEQARLDTLVSQTLATPEPADLGAWATTTAQVAAIVPPQPQQVTASAFLSALGWAHAPEFDDDHDNELSYRPFPIGPFLTANPEMDHTALAQLVHPDLERAHDAIDDAAAVRLSFNQGAQFASLVWADTFSGEDVTNALYAGTGLDKPANGRRVRTAASQ